MTLSRGEGKQFKTKGLPTLSDQIINLYYICYRSLAVTVPWNLQLLKTQAAESWESP